MSPNDVMSVQEASTYLAMDVTTLRELAAQRRILCVEVDGTFTFSKKSIDKWRAQKQSPTT